MTLSLINSTGQPLSMTMDGRPVTLEPGQVRELALDPATGHIPFRADAPYPSQVDEGTQALTPRYHLTTDCVGAFCFASGDAALTVTTHTGRFQSETVYDCFRFIPHNGVVTDLHYSVTNPGALQEPVARQKKNARKNFLFDWLVDSTLEVVLEGLGALALSVLAGFAAGVVAGLLTFFGLIALVFLLHLIGYAIDYRLRKSRRRTVNRFFADPSQEDDIGYLIQHIDKFCKQ